jgi:DNA-binding NarL/FixJ family response regulator
MKRKLVSKKSAAAGKPAGHQPTSVRRSAPLVIASSATRTEPAVASHAIRVLCVDDHAVLVAGLRAQFAIDGGIEVVGRLANASSMIEEVQRLRPNVVMMDIEMPGPDAFEMADRLKRSCPEVRVIVLSAHIRDAFISASFAAGASAYFAKVDELEDIVAGIYQVINDRAGTFVLGPRVRERCRPLANGVQATPASDNLPRATGTAPMTLLASLTPREIEILRLIGKGLSRVQIGAQLCRSVKTIDGHQDRMLRKLGIEARADLMRFAIREGLAQA